MVSASRSPLPLAARILIAALGLAGGAGAQLPLDPGEVVVTCFSGYCPTQSPPYGQYGCNPGYVVALFDTRDPAGNGAVLDQNWAAPSAHYAWTRANLGEVFGITLDGNNPPNALVTATTVYGDFRDGANNPVGFGPGGPGAVYQLDGTTGAIALFAQLPNTGAALGNIAYEADHDQFFVSNLDDGLIYRLDATGAILDTFDHGVSARPNEGLLPIPDDAGLFTPLGRRVWGLEDFQGRLYYAVWNEDPGCDPLNGPQFAAGGSRSSCPSDVTLVENEIWSVAIDPGTGALLAGTAQREIVLPPIDDGSGGYADGRTSNPVSDIEFQADGRMLVAERGRMDDYGRGRSSGQLPNIDAHRSRLLEYALSGGLWVPTGAVYGIGVFGETNSAGGVAPLCSGDLWATGDAIHYGNADRIYGLQWIRDGGNGADLTATEMSYLVDLDGDLLNGEKNQVGDVVAFDPGCACAAVSQVDATCNTDGSGNVTVTFQLTNQSGFTAEHLLFTPGGAFTFVTPVQDIPTLANGDTTTVSVEISGAMPGDTICFQVTLLKDTMEACCTVEVCVELPNCCWDAQFTIDCDPLVADQYLLDVTLVNLTGTDVYSSFLILPIGVTASQTWFDFSSSPIPPLGSVNLQVVLSGPNLGGTTQCLWFTAHNQALEECCSEKLTITFPRCDIEVPPDCCLVTQVVPCCPASLSGTITLSICNKSMETRTYDWDIVGLPADNTCGVQLADTQFFPSAGTGVTVPPGECVDLTIVVDCSTLAVGTPECAGFYVTVTNTASGAQFGCGGIVVSEDVVAKHDPGAGGVPGLADVVQGTTASLSFTVERTVGAGPVDLEIADLEPFGGFQNNLVSLDGLPPGDPVIRQASPPAGGTDTVTLTVDFEAFAPPGSVENVFVLADLDGDGVAERLVGSVVLRLVSAGNPVKTPGCRARSPRPPAGPGTPVVVPLR